MKHDKSERKQLFCQIYMTIRDMAVHTDAKKDKTEAERPDGRGFESSQATLRRPKKTVRAPAAAATQAF